MAILVTGTQDKLRAGKYGEATLVVSDRNVGAMLSVNVVQQRLGKLIDAEENRQRVELRARDAEAARNAAANRRVTAKESATKASATSKHGTGGGGIIGSIGRGIVGIGAAIADFLGIGVAIRGAKNAISLFIRNPLKMGGLVGATWVGYNIWNDIAKGGKIGPDPLTGANLGVELGLSAGMMLGGAFVVPLVALGYMAEDSFNWFKKSDAERKQDELDLVKKIDAAQHDSEPKFAKDFREMLLNGGKGVASWVNQKLTAAVTPVIDAGLAIRTIMHKGTDALKLTSASIVHNAMASLSVMATTIESNLPDLRSLLTSWITGDFKKWIEGFISSLLPKGTTPGPDAPPSSTDLDTAYQYQNKDRSGTRADPERAHATALSNLGTGNTTPFRNRGGQPQKPPVSKAFTPGSPLHAGFGASQRAAASGKVIPSSSTGAASQDELYSKAANYANTQAPDRSSGNIDYGKSIGACVRGTAGVLASITGDKQFAQLQHGGNAGSFTQGGSNPLTSSGKYNNGAALPSGYTPQIGDVVAGYGGHASGLGHIQVFDGRQWVSDFKQDGILPGYQNLTLYRMNDAGKTSINPNYVAANDLNGATKASMPKITPARRIAPVTSSSALTKPMSSGVNQNTSAYGSVGVPKFGDNSGSAAMDLGLMNLGVKNQIADSMAQPLAPPKPTTVSESTGIPPATPAQPLEEPPAPKEPLTGRRLGIDMDHIPTVHWDPSMLRQTHQDKN